MQHSASTTLPKSMIVTAALREQTVQESTGPQPMTRMMRMTNSHLLKRWIHNQFRSGVQNPNLGSLTLQRCSLKSSETGTTEMRKPNRKGAISGKTLINYKKLLLMKAKD